MKGPQGRIQLDIRRVWECPQCKTRIKMLGNTTHKLCSCQKDGVWMKIVEEPRQNWMMSGIQKMAENPDRSREELTWDDSENENPEQVKAKNTPPETKDSNETES